MSHGRDSELDDAHMPRTEKCQWRGVGCDVWHGVHDEHWSAKHCAGVDVEQGLPVGVGREARRRAVLSFMIHMPGSDVSPRG